MWPYTKTVYDAQEPVVAESGEEGVEGRRQMEAKDVERSAELRKYWLESTKSVLEKCSVGRAFGPCAQHLASQRPLRDGIVGGRVRLLLLAEKHWRLKSDLQ